MKTLELKPYVSGETITMEDYGTVNQQAGVGGSFRPASLKNFKDDSKRVAIIVKNAKGESGVVACSSAVSAGLRNKSITLSQLGNLHILENEEGKRFISLSSGTMPEVKVTSVKEEEVKLTTNSLKDLIAF